MMHHLNMRTISNNNCRPQVGLALFTLEKILSFFSGRSKIWPEQSSNDMFSSTCGWNICEHCGNRQQTHACEKCGVCRFGTFIVVRHMFGKPVNFTCFSVRVQDGKTCRNFCPDPLDDILWCNLMKMFLHPCWRLCLRSYSTFGGAERTEWTVVEFGGARSCGTLVENA